MNLLARGLGLITGALLVGLICGLIPFFIARKRGLQTLANAALVSCVVAGFLFGMLLAIPTCIVFTIVALVRKPPTDPKAMAAGSGQ